MQAGRRRPESGRVLRSCSCSGAREPAVVSALRVGRPNATLSATASSANITAAALLILPTPLNSSVAATVQVRMQQFESQRTPLLSRIAHFPPAQSIGQKAALSLGAPSDMPLVPSYLISVPVRPKTRSPSRCPAASQSMPFASGLRSRVCFSGAASSSKVDSAGASLEYDRCSSSDPAFFLTALHNDELRVLYNWNCALSFNEMPPERPMAKTP